MYEFECLTKNETKETVCMDECSPFSGMCYPEVEGVCGPDCNPN